MVSCTGNEGHFIPARIANPILQTIELGSNNKAQKAWTDEMIKEICMPIKVDRLGNVLESSSSYKNNIFLFYGRKQRTNSFISNGRW